MTVALPIELFGPLQAPPDPGRTGTFLELLPRTYGLMLVHMDDPTTPQFPPGWHPYTEEPIYIWEFEVWPLVCDQGELHVGCPLLNLLEVPA